MNKFSIVVGALLVGMGALIYLAVINSPQNIDIDPNTVLQVQSNDHVVGDPNASVVLFEFSDFECPACRAYHPVVTALGELYGDRIAIVTRHFPLPFHRNA